MIKHKLNTIRLFLLLLVSATTFGQIQVSNISSIETAVQGLAGEGVIISNITYSFDGGNPVGVFKDDFGVLGVTEGLLMTTGSATKARGPNDEACVTSTLHDGTVNFTELENLVSQPLYDLVVIEFDIKVATDILDFSYVFGSDEYPEYIESFHDVFGFFISGPGILGNKNLAVVPGTQSPVSVGTINHLKNSIYYVSNGGGDTPLDNIDVQYDGFTKPLVATVKVQPCESYHIKLAIADVNDANCDSGVFFQNNSFSARNKPKIAVNFEHQRFPYGIEGCNDFDVVITRGKNDLLNLNKEIKYDYEFSGTATLNSDYTNNLPTNIIIPIGQTSVTYHFVINQDANKEPEETIEFKITSGCSSFSEVTKKTISIKDTYDYPLSNVILCGGNKKQLNPTPQYPDNLIWENSPFLSCENCTSPTASNTSPKWFEFSANDPISGCQTTDSIFVDYLELIADFDIGTLDCYTVQDIHFYNKSKNATSYLWSFGDGNTSNEQEPTHTYGKWMDKSVKGNYTVTLLVENTSLNCRKTLIRDINLDEVLLVPNIITPNGDTKNETFQIKGIIGSCWKLSIYNRYGKMIYQNENYANEWSPSENSDGIYYYAIENKNGDRFFKGYILVIR